MRWPVARTAPESALRTVGFSLLSRKSRAGPGAPPGIRSPNVEYEITSDAQAPTRLWTFNLR